MIRYLSARLLEEEDEVQEVEEEIEEDEVEEKGTILFPFYVCKQLLEFKTTQSNSSSNLRNQTLRVSEQF